MKSYPQIAMRVFNTPLLLMPEKAETVASVLAERLGVMPMVELDALPVKAAILDGDDPEGDPPPRPYAVSNGIAVISIVGELVNRGSWLDALSGLTSYEGIADALQTALVDSTVSGILLDIDSPGGEASGAMETGSFVRKASATKPVTAYVNGAAASAAYAIAAGAQKIVVSPSSTLGSIGVVFLHVDRTEQMAKAGLKPTLIKKGAYKTDGTSMAPLSDDAKGRISALMDVIYGLFVSNVAALRPSLSEEDVRATEAGLFIGAKAVEAGLADEVGTMEDALRSFTSRQSTSPLKLGKEGPNMTDITRADHEAALATMATASTKSGASAERARVSAILGHPEAKGRESLAQHLAFETDMAPEAATAVLTASPRAEAPAPNRGSRLDGKVPAPKVEPDDTTEVLTEDEEFQKGAAEAKAALGIR